MNPTPYWEFMRNGRDQLPPQATKVIILGHGQHGKDAAAVHLVEASGLEYLNASLWFAQHHMMKQFPGGSYKNADQCYEDRKNHRALWYDEIARYTRYEPARLILDIFEISDVYCGVRRKAEFLAAVPSTDAIFWVDASKRLPLEDPSSMELRMDDPEVMQHVHSVIDNNGPEANLRGNVWAAWANWRRNHG